MINPMTFSFEAGDVLNCPKRGNRYYCTITYRGRVSDPLKPLNSISFFAGTGLESSVSDSVGLKATFDGVFDCNLIFGKDGRKSNNSMVCNSVKQ